VAPLRTGLDRAYASEDAFARGLSSRRGHLAVGALLVWVTLVALAVVLAWRQYDDAKDQVAHDLRNRAVVAGTVFDTYFAGQTGVLQAIAAAPSVRAGDVEKMRPYFRRIQARGAGGFTAGVGWLDRAGYPRASSLPPGRQLPNYADRVYFRRVLQTGLPFISQALVTRRTPLRRVIVTAVPTRDERGRITGVLTGALLLRPSTDNPRTTDLGYAGLEILDRAGQRLTLRSLARPGNEELVRTLRKRKQGVLPDAGGLDGERKHVVAFATSKAPGWTIVIDRSASAVFAPARRSLLIELGAIAAAGALGLVVLAWASRWSRRQLRDERSRIRAWVSLTSALNTATDPGEVREALATALAAQFPTALALVGLWRDEGDEERLSVSAGVRSPFSAVSGTSVEGVLPLLAQTGSLALPDHGAIRDTLPAIERAVRPPPGELYAERIAGAHAAGAAVVVLPAERTLGDDDRAVVRAHAYQAAEALLRIAQQQIEHETAIVLQRSLLPARLPHADGVTVAACYSAAGAGVEVGGDWYDVVCRSDGIVHLTVGDVAGHGIPAATLMGQLRTAFSAYALDHTSPSEIVRRVARHVRETHMVTMVCVTFDPLTRELADASAGHPPPLLLDAATQTITRLDRPGRPPLGWESSPPPFEDNHIVLTGPATLVLYTDGLVERRDRAIDDGIDALGARVAERVGDDLSATADHFVSGIVGDGAGDDAALLLVEVEAVPARFRLELAADPALLGGLRRRLRAWLSLQQVGQDRSADIVLAVSEACNNAIEHAYLGGKGTVALDLRHDGAEISIAIEDRGVWREPRVDASRGRGLAIMERLMPATTIERGPRGTRVVLRQTIA
jgi:anti-sigma regulatory factor (Ser/Thr protein kinase)